MKLREIRDKLLPMVDEADELSVDIKFLNDDNIIIDVTWWEVVGSPDDVDHCQYTLKEFKELLND